MTVFSNGRRVAAGIVASGVMVACAGMVAAEEGPKDVSVEAFRPRSSEELRRVRLDSARARFEFVRGAYEAGEILGNRFIGESFVDASLNLMEAGRDASGGKAGRVAAARDHFERLVEVLKVEEDRERNQCRVKTTDAAFVKAALLEAEYFLANEVESPGDGKGPTPREMAELDRLKRQAREKLDAEVEASNKRYEAELKAGTPQERAWEGHLARFKDGRVAFERTFGSYPRLYCYPRSLERIKEDEAAKAANP